MRHAIVDLADLDSVTVSMDGIDVVVNAIRLLKNIAPTELITMRQRLLTASRNRRGDTPRIGTVGGTGALRLPDDPRFWQRPALSQTTLPRGRAHAALRDQLEAGNAGDAWAYLIPPPAYAPEGSATDRWELVAPTADETAFTARAISYANFGAGVAEASVNSATGTQLIAWQH